ncbi:fibroblast growth factor receptor substrate 2 [Wyeomyia smithii]|uniref:fibroblast growth factor receptor substrate 2 n=1 Tax=Wyeomyia smithii TaxID=174621 RepID=UPI002467FCCD|nr:fibroblast growth factor receptor substrate 2 [Wyeomyia smithii]
MGCINSKKDINDVHPNKFYVINIDEDGTPLWSGQLEVSRTDLTLYRKGKEPTTWPLRCIRTYGYNIDQFSFEAGRRCTTGEGIYAFKCRRAETLFYTVQSYIQGRIYNDESTNPNDPYPIPVASSGPSVAARSVSQNNTATRSGQQQNVTGTGSYIINRTGIATSQSLSPNGTIHSNSNQSRSTDTLPIEASYLEPTSGRPGGQPQTITTRFQQGLRLSSVSSGPISPDVTSPGSPNSVTNILEVTTLNPLPTNITSNSTHHGVSNLYQEFPMKDSMVTGIGHSVNRMSLDITPLESAPSAENELVSTVLKQQELPTMQPGLPQITPESDPTRMYMNVNIACMTESVAKTKSVKSSSKSNSSLISINNNTGSFDENQYQNVRTPTSIGGASMFTHIRMISSHSIDPTRFYENLEPGEIKSVLLRGRYSKPDIFANVELPLDSSEPCTPTTANRKVHYIVLDLDQANSSHNINLPAPVTSPTAGSAPTTTNNNNNNPAAVNLNNPNDTTTTGTPHSQSPVSSGLLPPESPKKAGYATIDFDKTFALSNSTTPSSELDSEGSRKTRHNSTVTPLTRQSNSVSD